MAILKKTGKHTALILPFLALSVTLGGCVTAVTPDGYYRHQATGYGSYYYYPSLDIYFDAARRNYWRRDRDRWVQVKHVPHAIDLHRDRPMHLRVDSSGPYQKHGNSFGRERRLSPNPRDGGWHRERATQHDRSIRSDRFSEKPSSTRSGATHSDRHFTRRLEARSPTGNTQAQRSGREQVENRRDARQGIHGEPPRRGQTALANRPRGGKSSAERKRNTTSRPLVERMR